MSGKSAGQLAYEAYQRAEVTALRSPKAREMALAGKGWETLSGDEQVWWMITAAAVETEQVRLARQDRDQLRTAVLSLAAELENEAAASNYALESDALADAAARLRQIAEPA